MKHSDRPISRPDEDLFGRSDFSLVLAKSIDQLKVAADGFVIGLMGSWGSGKSSVMELTLRYLRHEEMARVSKVEGSCFTSADIERMAEAFTYVEPAIRSLEMDNLNVSMWERNHQDRVFADLCPSGLEAKAAADYWRLLKYVKIAPDNLVVRFSPWLIAGRAELASALISDVARAVGRNFGDDVSKGFAALLSRLSQVVPLAGAAVDIATGSAFGGLFSAGMDASDRLARRLTSGPTLDGVREQLRYALGALSPRKILVVVDDLDRLTPAEAVEMTSLIKGLGDLPNVVYLLGFDEDKLASLIGTELELNGREYLEKIVQYAVHLPPIDSDDLSRLLEAELDELLPDLQEYDRRRLAEAWISVISDYIRTPRDVRRLVNSFSVAHSGLRDYTDPIDLLILEAIRVNEPAIYDWVRRNLSELVD